MFQEFPSELLHTQMNGQREKEIVVRRWGSRVKILEMKCLWAMTRSKTLVELGDCSRQVTKVPQSILRQNWDEIDRLLQNTKWIIIRAGPWVEEISMH